MAMKSLLILMIVNNVIRGCQGVTADEMRQHLDSIIPSSGTDVYYDTVRPVLNQDHSVNVTADLHLIGINSFDNAEQKLTSTAYLELKWVDEIMGQATRWTNTAITEVYVPQNDAWLPDIALENGFESLKGLGDSFLYVKGTKSGNNVNVVWKPYQVFDSSCEVDIMYFPFDTTTCYLKFIIWSNSIDLVRLSVGTVGISTAEYEENSEWSIQSTQAYNSDTANNSAITFAIGMKRKPLYYILNILGPVILLGVLNVFVFVLPAGSGEKTGFSVTAFLSFAVFLTIISTELPQNSEKLSLFSAYLFIMTMVSTFVVVLTILQLQVFNRPDDKKVKGGLRSLTKFARRLQCRFCLGNMHGSVNRKPRQEPQSEEVELTWSDVSDGIDFVLFWVFLFFFIGFTLVVCVVSVFASG